VHPAVDDVELRTGRTWHWRHDGAVERELELRGGARATPGDASMALAPSRPLSGDPVEVDQGRHLSLVERIDAVECVGDLPVDVLRPEDALAAEPVPRRLGAPTASWMPSRHRGGDGAALRTESRTTSASTVGLPRESGLACDDKCDRVTFASWWPPLARYYHSNVLATGREKWSVTTVGLGSPALFGLDDLVAQSQRCLARAPSGSDAAPTAEVATSSSSSP